MDIAFCLFKYFPYGGMQRSFRAIAALALARGHRVRVYVHDWHGDALDGTTLCRVPLRGASTRSRQRHYAQFVRAHLAAHPVALVVGFNRMPGLDVYYAADNCEAARLHGVQGAIKRLLPRYRHLLAFERAVFGPDVTTRVMFIAGLQRERCLAHYALAPERCIVLPPGIARDDRIETERAALRAQARAEFGFDDASLVLLALGSGFRTKGLARTLHAIARLPAPLRARARLLVAGQDNARPFVRLGRRLGLQAQLHFLGGRADVRSLLAAADLLVHPARSEAAGMSLLEAGCAGLPVLASAACGYAGYVSDAGFGCVVPEPFAQREFEARLASMLGATAAEQQAWRARGFAFARTADIYDRPRHALDFIEAQAAR